MPHHFCLLQEQELIGVPILFMYVLPVMTFDIGLFDSDCSRWCKKKSLDVMIHQFMWSRYVKDIRYCVNYGTFIHDSFWSRNWVTVCMRWFWLMMIEWSLTSKTWTFSFKISSLAIFFFFPLLLVVPSFNIDVFFFFFIFWMGVMKHHHHQRKDITSIDKTKGRIVNHMYYRSCNT